MNWRTLPRQTAPTGWKERGRLDPSTRYYTSARFNPLYDAVGRIVEWVLRRNLRRDLAGMR